MPEKIWKKFSEAGVLMIKQFYHLCKLCRKNRVLVSFREKFPVCYECHKKQLKGEIKDAKLKKMFDIPEEFYKENIFLRKIKIYYLKYGELTEKQITAFKKTVDELKTRDATLPTGNLPSAKLKK